ncbi:DAD family-domain-containing protein [Scheffersomyces coipomensis]|uniref:DAD family-domain-containing protein n=1 Tax=Scheffersomyces coipomensis TaxID=1788519 RepID=UPI00315DD8E2
MARKDSAAVAAAALKKSQSSNNSSNSTGSKNPLSKISNITSSINEVFSAINTTYADYFETLTPRLKLIDIFLVFLVALGILQFIHVLLIGSFPFNAFLGGFISCVGQFVLTVSLRLQVKETHKSDEKVNEEEDDDAEEDEEEIVDEELVIKSDEPKVSDKIFKVISPERSFGDFIFASLILHFIVIHFIN